MAEGNGKGKSWTLGTQPGGAPGAPNGNRRVGEATEAETPSPVPTAKYLSPNLLKLLNKYQKQCHSTVPLCKEALVAKKKKKGKGENLLVFFLASVQL